MWIGTANCWDKEVYPSLFLLLTTLGARGLAHCSTSYVSFFPTHLQVPELSDVLSWTCGTDAKEDSRWFHGSYSHAMVL